MLRTLTAITTGLIFSLGLAGSASALTILPDPATYSFGSGNKLEQGAVDFLSVTPTSLTMRLLRTEGKPSGLAILVLDSTLTNIKEPTSVGTTPGADFDIINSTTAFSVAFFAFDKPWKKSDTQTDTFFINYITDNLAVGDQLFFALIGKKFSSLGEFTATIVPEPTTALLLGIGLAGLAMQGRRGRKQR